MGQCGGPQQAGNHPIPGVQAWRAAPFRNRRQAWAGVARPVAICPRRPRFFFFLLIYPATPLRTAARHSRFHRSFLFSDPVFCMAKKKRCPTPRKSISCFAHILQNPMAKTRTWWKFSHFRPRATSSPRRSDCEFDLVAPGRSFLSLPVIYPATPLRAPTRHSRFRRSFFNPGRPGPKRTLE
jgi:hypothetical protein